MGLLGNSWEFLEYFVELVDYLRIAEDYWGLLGITGNYWILVEITVDHGGSHWIFLDDIGLLGITLFHLGITGDH